MADLWGADQTMVLIYGIGKLNAVKDLGGPLITHIGGK